MIESIAIRRFDALQQFAIAVGDKDAFVRGVWGSDKLSPGFSCKIKECGTLATVLC